jgi:hypothetical protein
MVKRSLNPGQPLSPAIPEVRRGPSRFLQATSAVISPLLAQHCLTRLCLITLRGTLDPGLLRTAMQLRCQSEVAGLRTMAPASMAMDCRAGPCQRFARNCATRNLTSPQDPTSAAPFTCLVAWVGEVVRCDVNHPHINGMQGVRGSNSPQLHPGQRPSPPSTSPNRPPWAANRQQSVLPGRSGRPARQGAVVQLDLTRVVGGNLVKVMSWYDNEWGFASQMVQVAVQQLGLDIRASV